MPVLGDLLIITPSRGRPQNIARLLSAVHNTTRLTTHVYVGIDDDDSSLQEYSDVMAEHGHAGDFFEVAPRMGLREWTNHIALKNTRKYPFFASLGDDMVPVTRGWDRALIRVIMDMGGVGFAYPWDGLREDIPECVVLSSDIVDTLGWMALPVCQHFWIDDAWGELGRAAGCLRHCRAVTVNHLHPAKGTAPDDATYGAAKDKIIADRAAYHEWHRTRMAADAVKIVKLREAKLKK